MRPLIGTLLYFYHHRSHGCYFILDSECYSLSSTYRHTGALCAMKEVNIIPDDAKSLESLKQLEQVWPYFFAVYSALMVSLQSNLYDCSLPNLFTFMGFK